MGGNSRPSFDTHNSLIKSCTCSTEKVHGHFNLRCTTSTYQCQLMEALTVVVLCEMTRTCIKQFDWTKHGLTLLWFWHGIHTRITIMMRMLPFSWLRYSLTEGPDIVQLTKFEQLVGPWRQTFSASEKSSLMQHLDQHVTTNKLSKTNLDLNHHGQERWRCLAPSDTLK